METDMPQHSAAPSAAPASRIGSPGTGGHDGFGLGAALGPLLREICEGRLSDIEWFRSSWQRGGASTGFATWHTPAGKDIPVLVKLPVGAVEYSWTLRLGAVDIDDWDDPQSCALSTPRVLAAGEALGGHDLAWLVLEKLEGQTLGAHLDKPAFEALLHAAADFQSRALQLGPVDKPPPATDWLKAVHRSREIVPDCGVAEASRWKEALRKLEKGLPAVVKRWEHRPAQCWCHGDLHPGNAMYRLHGNGNRTCVLIDLGLVHAGHWVEDAVYLERQYWGHAEMLDGVKPVSELAKCRRDKGLTTNDGYADLANIRRVLMAACVPLQLANQGNPRYVKGALDTLERLLPQVVR